MAANALHLSLQQPSPTRAPARLPLRRTLIDRLVEWVDPIAGRRRLLARAQLDHARAYLAAAPGDPWNPRRATASANADHQADAAKLRAKSRFLVQNVDYIAAGMAARANLMVGTGITPKWGGRHGKRLSELWAQQLPYIDADGTSSGYGFQRLIAAALDVDGEVLIRLRPRRPSDGLPVPLQFQALEVDWLDTTRTAPDEGNNPVIGGKEYDALGRCVAYWLWDTHPGDTTTLRGLRSNRSRRVPAAYILHVFSPTRPGAGRGFPRLAPVITRVRDLQLLEDAEAARKNLESRLSVLSSQELSTLESAPEDGTPLAPSSLGELAGGGITDVGPGRNLTVVQPQALPGFEAYCRHNIHLICAGAGFTFEQATGILTDTNFSSARVGQLNQRKEIESLQWLTLVPQALAPMCHAFAAQAALAGLLGPAVTTVTPGVDYTLEHSTPKWDYVNPKDEIAATLDEIAGGLTSFSEATRRRGDDPEIRVAELAEDIKRFKAAGIWDDLISLMTGSRAATNTAAGSAPAAPPKPAAKPAG